MQLAKDNTDRNFQQNVNFFHNKFDRQTIDAFSLITNIMEEQMDRQTDRLTDPLIEMRSQLESKFHRCLSGLMGRALDCRRGVRGSIPAGYIAKK